MIFCWAGPKRWFWYWRQPLLSVWYEINQTISNLYRFLRLMVRWKAVGQEITLTSFSDPEVGYWGCETRNKLACLTRGSVKIIIFETVQKRCRNGAETVRYLTKKTKSICASRSELRGIYTRSTYNNNNIVQEQIYTIKNGPKKDFSIENGAFFFDEERLSLSKACL